MALDGQTDGRKDRRKKGQMDGHGQTYIPPTLAGDNENMCSPNFPNKTCHRDRIARLTVPAHHIKNFNIKLFANADAAADADAKPTPGVVQ